MDLSVIEASTHALWQWAALPLLALAAVTLTVALRAPQLTRLAAGLTALRAPKGDRGSTTAQLATWLATAGALGASAAVGVATSVALGGPAAVAWIWAFGFLLAPLRYAEVLLARTDAPGRASGEAAGSLTNRFLRSDSAGRRALGFALAGTLTLTAFAFIGGVHGQAFAELGDALVPGAGGLLFTSVVIGAALAAAGPERAAAVAGWLGLGALIVVLACALVAAAEDPGRAASSLAQMVADATKGSPMVGAFTGALASEAAHAALAHVLPSLAAATGVSGAVHADARATARGQAAASLYEPFAATVLATLLGVAIVSTGAFYEPVDTRAPITETLVVTSRFESVSQRQELDRRFTGYIRVRGGDTRDTGTYFATERGMIQGRRFLYWGQPADLALHFEEGRAVRILRPGDHGALTTLPPSALAHVEIAGRMLPRGAELLARAHSHGEGTSTLGKASLAGMLGLMAAALAAWGFAVRRAWPKLRGKGMATALALLPAAGLALQLALRPPWLPALGGLAVALWVALTALALLSSAKEASKIAR